MVYLFQLITKDAQLQLTTEITAPTLQVLQIKAKNLVKNNPIIVGERYIIATVELIGERFNTVTLKTDTITGEQ